MISQELSDAISKHRNNPKFHKLVKHLLCMVRCREFEVGDIKDAYLVIEYDLLINKEAAQEAEMPVDGG